MSIHLTYGTAIAAPLIFIIYLYLELLDERKRSKYLRSNSEAMQGRCKRLEGEMQTLRQWQRHELQSKQYVEGMR